MRMQLMEFGDQRAKDLIDRTEGVRDPRRRIALLRRALRYGRTGTQARKAYQSLGIAYEELGNTSRAINYYTKALELGDANPITRFWRGQVHYRRGEWEAARRDFEHVLTQQDLRRLAPKEHALAQRYLAELILNQPIGW